MTNDKYARSLKWADLIDQLNFYRDFPKYRAKEPDMYEALLNEQHRRVADGTGGQ